MLSNRNFPRGGKCNPHNSFVLYLKKSRYGAQAGNIKYGYVGSRGVASVGSFGYNLPAGTYYLTLVNQSHKNADVTIHGYSTKSGLKIYNA